MNTLKDVAYAIADILHVEPEDMLEGGADDV